MRLVNADRLRKRVHAIGGCGAEPDSWADGWDKAIDEVITLIDEEPTVSVQTGNEERKHKCAVILEHYGLDNQLTKLCEECGELIAEACRAKSMGGFMHEDFIEELADIAIMIAQIKFALIRQINGLLIYEDTIDFKLDRQLERITHERK